VHVENFNTKTGVVKHLLSELDYEAGLGDIVSPEKKPGNELHHNRKE